MKINKNENEITLEEACFEWAQGNCIIATLQQREIAVLIRFMIEAEVKFKFASLRGFGYISDVYNSPKEAIVGTDGDVYYFRNYEEFTSWIEEVKYGRDDSEED